ncbi:VPLPA-CTERM sorting domain-containing protein [Roseibium sp. HPY-6]|uniref:VPLPA-CTERM sorting domain-containing protein n=1 Tax=Roseibium sp. HPY-6 TaxID=3229852 RepID=UPI00338EC328
MKAMVKKFICVAGLTCSSLLMATNANAALMSVSGPASNAGAMAQIIMAPTLALDSAATNLGQQGFNEQQNVLLTSSINVDGGTIAAGTRVNSHMIFLNKGRNAGIVHFGVDWTFSNRILGVMSDFGGNLETSTTSILGSLSTTYPNAGFPARGLEANDSYSFLGNVLTVNMRVTEPGDWIRVVTAVPIPAALPLMGGALAGLGFLGWRRKRSSTAA